MYIENIFQYTPLSPTHRREFATPAKAGYLVGAFGFGGAVFAIAFLRACFSRTCASVGFLNPVRANPFFLLNDIT
jgi:hypothetical protein